MKHDTYMVTGGVYEDFKFERIRKGTEETYGPFGSWQQAYDVWKSKMWLNVDDGQHRLQIVRMEDESYHDAVDDPHWG